MDKRVLDEIRIRAGNAIKDGIFDGWISVDGVYVVNGDDEIIAECNSEENAYFIGESRQDIPKLLAEIDRLKDLEEQLRNILNASLKLLDDSYDLLSDSIYHNHPTTEELSEFLNVKGERD